MTYGLFLLMAFDLAFGFSEDLIILDKARAPMSELSGLGTVLDKDVENNFIAVSDSSTSLIKFHIIEDKIILNPGFVKTPPQIVKKYKKSSQFEALATHSASTYILQESSSKIFQLSSDMSHLISTIAIPKLPNLRLSYEGIAIISENHIVLAHKNDPTVLVDLRSCPEQKWWAVHSTHSPLLGGKNCDLSDLYYSEGNLYTLSESCRSIAKFTVGKYDTPISKWRFPKEIEKAEGLVVFAKEKRFLISSDLKNKKPNLYLLKRR